MHWLMASNRSINTRQPRVAQTTVNFELRIANCDFRNATVIRTTMTERVVHPLNSSSEGVVFQFRISNFEFRNSQDSRDATHWKNYPPIAPITQTTRIRKQEQQAGAVNRRAQATPPPASSHHFCS